MHLWVLGLVLHCFCRTCATSPWSEVKPLRDLISLVTIVTDILIQQVQST